MIVITGMSALAWWNTPPLFKNKTIEPEQYTRLFGVHEPANPLQANRKNTRYVDERITARLLFDLKGIPLPIDVEADYGSMRLSPFADVCRMVRQPDTSLLHSLGNDLFIARPSLALVQAAQTRSLIETLMLMYEVCGTYTKPAVTNLIRPLLTECIENANGATNPSAYFQEGSKDP